MSEALQTHPPQPTTEADPRLRIQVVDVSQGVNANAVDRAEEYINERTNQRGVRGILRKIWHGNIARDFYRQREIRRGREEIVQTGNLYTLDGGGQADHDRAMGAVVERFTADYTHEGEQNNELNATPEGAAFMAQVQQLVHDFASGTIGMAELETRRQQLLAGFGQHAHAQDRQQGLMYADNIIEVAIQARAAFEHGAGLDRIDGYLGEARMGVRSETRREASDRILDWLHRHHVTMVNEATVGAAVGIAMGIAKFTVKKGISAASIFAGMGVGAGIVGGVREHLRVGQERQLHLRQRAEGMEMPAQANRRAQLETTRYETVTVQELMNNLRQAMEGLDPTDANSINRLMSLVAAARTRIELGDETNADFIQYSSKTEVENERLELDIMLAQAEVALEGALANNADFAGANLDELMQAMGDANRQHILGDVQEKDAAFRRIRRARVMRMAGIAFVAGETFGMIAQELHSLVDSGLRGVFEGPGGDRHTLLAGLRGGSDQHREFYDGGYHMKDFGIDLPKGWHIHQDIPNGKYIMTDDHGKVILDHVRFDSQGNIAQGERHYLIHGLGLKLNQHHLRYWDNTGPGKYGGAKHPAWVDHYVTSIGDKSTPYEVPAPLPIYSRRGLESLRPAPGGGYYAPEARRNYYGNYEVPGRRVVPFAPEVLADPDAKIDTKAAARRYFGSLRPGYRKTLASMARELGHQPNANNPKVIVSIPAAAHQEGRQIYRALEQYAKQEGVSPDDFEIVVFANNPKGSKRDQTIPEVERFQREHPEIKVRLMTRELTPEEAKIGWVRKAASDAIITDLMARGIDLDQVMLVSNDADSNWINERYLQTIIEKSEANPDVDGFVGFIDWGFDAYKAHPETLAATRLMQMIDIYARVKKNQMTSTGPNYAYRPSAYLAIGGYNPNATLAEDVELGRMISSMRAGANSRRPIAFLGRVAGVNVSARRALAKLFKDGGAPIQQWEDGFDAVDDIRNREFDLDNFDFSDPANVDQMVQNTEKMLNETLRVYRGVLEPDRSHSGYRANRLATIYDNETLRQLGRMLRVIGIEPIWNPDGTFRIADARRMVANLERWQAAH